MEVSVMYPPVSSLSSKGGSGGWPDQLRSKITVAWNIGTKVDFRESGWICKYSISVSSMVSAKECRIYLPPNAYCCCIHTQFHVTLTQFFFAQCSICLELLAQFFTQYFHSHGRILWHCIFTLTQSNICLITLSFCQICSKIKWAYQIVDLSA